MKTNSVSGMTLIEVLVAFVVFVLLIAALVGLANTGLDTWTAGETRKDSYDRAQALLDQISQDLRNMAGENVIHVDGRDELMPMALLCDFDDNRSQRVRFVRGGDMERIRVQPQMQIKKKTPSMYYGDYWEIAYVMDSDGTKNTLYRAIRYFDRRTEYTLLRDQDIARTNAKFFQDYATPLEKGVLFLGFKFWTQDTVTWNAQTTRYFTCSFAPHRPMVQLSAPGKCSICGKPAVEKLVTEAESPSLIWDSTRKVEQTFRYHKRRQDRTDPDFVYPEIVQITLVMESHVSQVRGLKLTQPLGEQDMVIKVTDTSGLPDPPYYVKVGNEWIEYEDRSYDEIRVRRRGARGTKAQPHAQGQDVRFGDTFVTEVRLPVYRPATFK